MLGGTVCYIIYVYYFWNVCQNKKIFTESYLLPDKKYLCGVCEHQLPNYYDKKWNKIK